MDKDFQRWTAKRKVELLLQLIRGETKPVDACREHDPRRNGQRGRKTPTPTPTPRLCVDHCDGDAIADDERRARRRQGIALRNG